MSLVIEWLTEMKNFMQKRFLGTRPGFTFGPTYLLAFALLMGLIGFSACSDGDESDPAAGPAGKNASNAEIDIKSLVNVNSETFLALDEIGGQMPKPNTSIVVNAQHTPRISVRGWAVDQRAKTGAGGVIINVDGNTDVLANYGQPRPDVATNLKNPDYTNSGFTASIDSATLSKGHHTLTMRVVTADKKGYFEQKQKYDVEVQ
jgi:hypothetical protein